MDKKCLPRKPARKSGRAPPEINTETGPVISYVYILGSEGGGPRKTYVGWTTDPDRRLEQHNTGRGAKSTRGRRWCVLYLERYETRNEAMRRECVLKRDKAFRASVRLEAE